MEHYNATGDVEKSQKARPAMSPETFPHFHRSFTLHYSKSRPGLQSFERNGSIKSTSFRAKVKKLSSIFNKSSKHLKTGSNESLPLSKFHVTESTPGPRSLSSPFESVYLPGTEDKVVIYFTSLRGIRRTFLDCSFVLMILRAFRIELDERDISMHLAYRKELLNVLGEKSGTLSLPQVFIKGKHIGGAEAFTTLHETGELAKMLRGIPIRTTMKACDECGDIRFVPCVNCNGSRKVFDEDEGKVVRCLECNENGLIHCEICNVS